MTLRAGLWFLALVPLAVGVLGAVLPRLFYDAVPWVALSPPYSEHLTRDYGMTTSHWRWWWPSGRSR